jgi:D-alanyl-D-alanine carboxypeptidase
MRICKPALLGVLLLSAICGAQGPEPAIRARIESFVAALNGGPDQYEAMARDAFTPELLAKRSAADRRRLVERVRVDFGTISAPRVTRDAEGPLTLHVRGTTGLEGRIELRLEPAPPHRITGIAIEVGRDDGPAETLPPLPIDASMLPDALSRALDAYIGPLVADDRFAGVVLVAKDGAPVFEKAYGLADRGTGVSPVGTPNRVTTRFSLGSINKIITKTAIARLISEGRLTTADTIGKLLPDYPNTAAKAATVEQLLEHRAGIVDFFGPAFTAAPKDRFRSNQDYFALVAPQPLLFEPGARRQYCNGCYIVLGAIIERLSGMSYEDYVTRHVFTPAGMTGAGFFHADRLPPDTAHGYTRRGREGDDSLRNSAPMHGVAGSGAGGAYASARDLLAFDTALRGQKLLDAKWTAWMLGVDQVSPGRSDGDRMDGGIGIAGGAPGVNAVLDSSLTWTVVVVGNLDPPVAERLGVAIHRQLTR